MKIGRIETFYVPPRWLFVRVETDDGATGWGEASLEVRVEGRESLTATVPLPGSGLYTVGVRMVPVIEGLSNGLEAGLIRWA